MTIARGNEEIEESRNRTCATPPEVKRFPAGRRTGLAWSWPGERPEPGHIRIDAGKHELRKTSILSSRIFRLQIGW